MQPSGSADYMTEINRSFLNMNKKHENEVHNLDSLFSSSAFSPINRTFTNRSSSSDSTSPESFPEYPTFMPATSDYSTPTSFRQETTKLRPITGRKLINNFNQITMEPPGVIAERNSEELDPFNMSYTSDDSFLNTSNYMLKNESNIPQNVLYELFPAENKGFEFKTQLKNRPSPVCLNQSTHNSLSPISPTVSPMSPLSLEISSSFSNYSHNCQISNVPTRSHFYTPNSRFHLPQSSVGSVMSSPNFRQYNQVASAKLCTFCRKNGETAMVYSDHTVKELVEGRYVVTCPILRCHVCYMCGATGDNAHTITYCPILKNTNNGRPLQSTTITLKNTRIKSNGKRRY